MIVAVCIDDNAGMLFNSRRQSRDRELIKDFMQMAKENCVMIKPFSSAIFEGEKIIVDENFLENADENDFCFVEDESITPYAEKIKEIIVYKWNRVYPSDVEFEMPMGFILQSSTDFTGFSHDTITKEIYRRG